MELVHHCLLGEDTLQLAHRAQLPIPVAHVQPEAGEGGCGNSLDPARDVGIVIFEDRGRVKPENAEQFRMGQSQADSPAAPP